METAVGCRDALLIREAEKRRREQRSVCVCKKGVRIRENIRLAIEKRVLISASRISENPWNGCSFETSIALWIFVFKRYAFLFSTSPSLRSERNWLPRYSLKVSCVLPAELIRLLLLLSAAQIPAWQRLPWRFTLFSSRSAIELVAPPLLPSHSLLRVIICHSTPHKLKRFYIIQKK